MMRKDAVWVIYWCVLLVLVILGFLAFAYLDDWYEREYSDACRAHGYDRADRGSLFSVRCVKDAVLLHELEGNGE